MNDSLPTPTSSTPDLQAAVRRARLEDAERSSMAADLRQAEIARLESLNEALQPVFAQLPREAEMFDHGLVPLERPRLFVDMIAYVEMARDRRTFRFMQESRAGRALITESDEIVRMAEAVTFYLGRRVVEREKAIARDAHFQPQETQAAPEALPPPRVAAVLEAAPVEDEVALPVTRRGFSGVDVFFAFILGGVAMLALFVIAAWLDMKTLWPFGKLLG
jgi:hypothetical protein